MAGAEQVVRDAFERWNSGLREADPALLDPEVEIHSALTQGVWTGYEGTNRWASEIDQHFDAWRVTIDTSRELGPDAVLALGAIHMQGRESGVKLEQPTGWVVELRDGRILRLRIFTEPAEAIAAAERL